MPEIQLSQGTISYRDEGSGPPVLFVHGLLVDGLLWESVIPPLSDSFRCITPTLPLGSHIRPMEAGADLSPLGLARLIAELIERLELDRVTLVGNDTGGALSQLVAAHHPEHLGALVLTNCDAFENFPPRVLRPLLLPLRYPVVSAGIELVNRSARVRKLTNGPMKLTVNPIPDRLLKAWITPLRNPAVRRDVAKVVGGISPQYTLEAAERLYGFDRPATIIWGLQDPYFPLRDAERLVEILPDARLERIESARAFVPLDAPDRVAELVAAGSVAPVHTP
jgi:pimeloyl-ACP methyl ester carboxylesterase